MSQQITHPSHPNHVLSLLPRPTHTQAYLCDACGYQINDASAYQCRACNIDLHINCATLPMPMSVAHPSHPHRPNLAFSTPYSSGIRFDAHLGCCPTTNPGVAIQASTRPQTHMQHYQAAPVPNPIYQVPAGTQFATRPPLNSHPAPANYVNYTNPSSNVRPNVGNGMWNQVAPRPLNNHPAPTNYVNYTNPSSNVRPNVGNGMWNQFAIRPLNNHPAPTNYVNYTNPSSNVRPNVGNGMWNHEFAGFAYGTDTQAAGYDLGQGLHGGGGPNDGGGGGPIDGGDGNYWGYGGGPIGGGDWNDWGYGGGPIDGGDWNDWGDGGGPMDGGDWNDWGDGGDGGWDW